MSRTIGWLFALCVVAGLVQALPAGSPAAQAQPQPAGVVTEAAASEAARASGERVEVVSLRGETREVYALPSGSFEMVQHQRPVRTRKDGRWLPVDPTLTRLPDGGLAPIASSVDIRLSGGGDEPFVRMSRAGLGFGLSWPTRLPVPTVDGDTATYPEVLPGVDLQVRADVDGFAQLLVVKTPQAARDPALARLRLRLDAPRLVVAEDAEGVLRARDAASGSAVFEAPAPVMWDSPPVASPILDATDGPGDSAAVAGVGVDLGQDELALVPDAAMLAAPGTRFPVYIDPVWKTAFGASSTWNSTVETQHTGCRGARHGSPGPRK